ADLLTSCNEEVKAPIDIEGAERRDDCGDLCNRDQQPIERTQSQAKQAADSDRARNTERVFLEQIAGRERDQTNHRSHRQVDVAGQNNCRLADRDDCDERYVEQDLLEVGDREEERRLDRDDGNHGKEDEQDPDFAEPSHQGECSLEAKAAGECRIGWRIDYPHAHASAWPVAAAMIRSCDASSRSNSAATRPSCKTTIRSAMPSTSSSSLEMRTIAMPCAASCEMIR